MRVAIGSASTSQDSSAVHCTPPRNSCDGCFDATAPRVLINWMQPRYIRGGTDVYRCGSVEGLQPSRYIIRERNDKRYNELFKLKSGRPQNQYKRRERRKVLCRSPVLVFSPGTTLNLSTMVVL